MPTFDLRGINVAKYKNTSGVITYDPPISAGAAMGANLELRFAEGRLYAESALSEYMKLATGGTISLATKYIPVDAQALMYGSTANARTLSTSTIVNGLKTTAKDAANYVGVSFYAPDVVDGVNKYTCVFILRALFGPPSLVYQTRGESITFQTPTTSGEFLPNHAATQDMLEVAVVDAEADAIAWCDEVFGASDARLASLTIGSIALTPAFDPSVFVYYCTTTDATSTITATCKDVAATVEILNGVTEVTNGAAATWSAGANVLTCEVTNGDATATYYVTVVKTA